jgi:hypothetical protein
VIHSTSESTLWISKGMHFDEIFASTVSICLSEQWLKKSNFGQLWCYRNKRSINVHKSSNQSTNNALLSVLIRSDILSCNHVPHRLSWVRMPPIGTNDIVNHVIMCPTQLVKDYECLFHIQDTKTSLFCVSLSCTTTWALISIFLLHSWTMVWQHLVSWEGK